MIEEIYKCDFCGKVLEKNEGLFFSNDNFTRGFDAPRLCSSGKIVLDLHNGVFCNKHCLLDYFEEKLKGE